MTEALEIRLKKGRDSPHSFVLVRPDGTHTRQHDRTQGFFPPHDLTHFAVEVELGYRRGFYGIIADGWDLTDFGHPWPKGPFPADADPAELIVGILDLERAAGERWSAAQFNDAVLQKLTNGSLPSARFAKLTDADLARVRAKRAELLRRWSELPAGETMVLWFPLRPLAPE